MKKHLLLFLLVGITQVLISQCNIDNGLVFRTQTKLDSFFNANPNLDSLDIVTFDTQNVTSDRVHDLSKMSNVKYINKLSICPCSELEELHGLEGLTKVNEFYFRSMGVKSYDGLKNLKTVNKFELYFSVSGVFLSAFDGLNVQEEMTLHGSGFLDAKINASDGLSLSIKGNNYNAFIVDIFANPVKGLNVEIDRSEGISFEGFENDAWTLNKVEITDSKYIGMAGLSEKENLNYLTIANSELIFDRGDSFSFQVRELEGLYIESIDLFQSFNASFPNLSSIGKYVGFVDNPNLESLESMNELEPLEYDEDPSLSHIRLLIKDNLNLITCPSDYICEFTDKYPGRTYLYNNGPDVCSSITDILEECDSSVSVIDLDMEAFHVFPNPTFGQLKIEYQGNIKDCTLYSLEGRKVYNQKGGTELDISTYDPGIYLLSVQTEKGVVNRRIVKME